MRANDKTHFMTGFIGGQILFVRARDHVDDRIWDVVE